MPVIRGNTCLIVEDDPISQSILRHILKGHFDEILTLDDGLKARELLAQRDVDCVISDVEIPHLSGLELLRSVRELRPRTPFIVISKFENLKNIREAWRMGAFDFIEKPFQRSRVVDCVEIALSFGREFMAVDPSMNSDLYRRLQTKAEQKSRVIWDQENLLAAIGPDPRTLAELVAAARETIDSTLRELHSALNADHGRDLPRLLHRLRGVASNIRAEAFSEAVEQLEKALEWGQSVRDTDLAFLDRQAQDLFAVFDGLKPTQS